MSEEKKPHEADAAHDAHAAEPEAHTPHVETHDAGHEEPAVISADASVVEPAHDDSHSVTEPDHVAPAAAATAAARPIWSDHGDAPFDDGDEKPIREKNIKKANIKAPSPTRSEEPPRSAGSETLEVIKTVVFALLIAFVLRVMLFQPFTIPSASMEPNLYEGDYIVVTKWSYGYSKYSSGLPVNLPLGEGRLFNTAPKRGDIAVFKLPRDNKTDYIKRVIGLPGDRVQMIANKLYINGQPVQDAIVDEGQVADAFGPRSIVRARETLPNGKSFMTQDFGPGGDLDDTGVYEVPAGHYFMMGDNRDNSIDSRVAEYAGVGMVPEQNLVGKAQIIMFSWEPGASLFNPVSWFANIRPSRFFRILD